MRRSFREVTVLCLRRKTCFLRRDIFILVIIICSSSKPLCRNAFHSKKVHTILQSFHVKLPTFGSVFTSMLSPFFSVGSKETEQDPVKKEAFLTLFIIWQTHRYPNPWQLLRQLLPKFHWTVKIQVVQKNSQSG